MLVAIASVFLLGYLCKGRFSRRQVHQHRDVQLLYGIINIQANSSQNFLLLNFYREKILVNMHLTVSAVDKISQADYHELIIMIHK